MESARQKRFARLILLVVALAGGAWLWRLDYARKITTNVIDLIPRDEQSPEISLLRTLVDERQARIILLALADPATPQAAPAAAGEEFARALRASPLFAEATVLEGRGAGEALGAFLFQRRFDYLLPAWLETQERAFAQGGLPQSSFSPWLAERTVTALDAFLARPEAAAFQDLLPQDPLLLVPSLALNAQLLPQASAAARPQALIWARLAVSPLDEAGQEPVFAVINHALASVQRTHPGVTLQWTGVNRIAAASKDRIRAELSWLNGLSLAAVLLIALIFVRQTWKALHLVPVIFYALLCGWVAVTAVFARVHILVFVVGALLMGVAIDYGFYLYLQPALRAGETYREKLGRLLRPLLTSCLTTVIGFSFLLFSELPLIRHLGVFVSAGLVGALGAAILYFAQLDRPYLAARAFAERSVGPRGRRRARWLWVAALLVALIGPWRLHWHDSIRELEVPNPALEANDAAVRALFGERSGQTAYITRGDTPAHARASLERFLAWHARAFPGAPATGMGLVLPTAGEVRAMPERLAMLRDFPDDLQAALIRHDYDAASFAPFFAAWHDLAARPRAPAYPTLAADLQSRLTGPLGMLFFRSDHATWFLTLADNEPGIDPPPGLDTLGTNQLQTLNTLFARYRVSALHLSLMGLGLIGLSVFVLYGLKRGLRIFMIPAGSCLFAFGVLGLTGHPLNMFHLLGAFLGVCLSHNYAIFSAENAGRGEPPPVSIRLSALTTAASFGVLGISRIAVVAALGSTVALIVLTALVIVELEPSPRRQPPLSS
jgi:predicted exporter